MAISIVSNSKDFRTALIENMACYDSSRETAEFRVREWLWESKDNRVIGRDYEDYDNQESLATEGIDSVVSQVSEFSDLTNKKIMAFYLVTKTNELPSNLYLKTDLDIEAMNNDNMEVNKFIDDTSYKWNNYSDEIYEEHLKFLTRLIGEDIMKDLKATAPGALRNEQVGPLEKQLRYRDIAQKSDWPQRYQKIKDVKTWYRDKVRKKEEYVFEMTELFNMMTFGDYQSRADQLKKNILFNIESSGGIVDAQVL